MMMPLATQQAKIGSGMNAVDIASIRPSPIIRNWHHALFAFGTEYDLTWSSEQLNSIE